MSSRKRAVGLFAFFISVSSAFAVTPFNRQYSDIQKEMHEITQKSPDTAQVFSLGLNDTGQVIEGLKIGVGPVKNLVVSTHHGNEYGSTEVALAFAHSLAEAPVSGQTVYVIPVLNVSGYNARTRTETGIDPNRDYPGPCGTDGPFHLKSTKALADFIAKEAIVVSATLHTYGPIVLYPWGVTSHDVSTEYDSLYTDLGNAATRESHYAVGNSANALYPANGCYEDYAFWQEGAWSLLFELGFTHQPDQQAVDELIRVNVPGLRAYLEQAPTKRADHHAFTGKCDSATRGRGRMRVDE